MEIEVIKTLEQEGFGEIPIEAIVRDPLNNFSIFKCIVLAPCGHARCTAAAHAEGLLPIIEVVLN